MLVRGTPGDRLAVVPEDLGKEAIKSNSCGDAAASDTHSAGSWAPHGARGRGRRLGGRRRGAADGRQRSGRPRKPREETQVQLLFFPLASRLHRVTLGGRRVRTRSHGVTPEPAPFSGGGGVRVTEGDQG